MALADAASNALSKLTEIVGQTGVAGPAFDSPQFGALQLKRGQLTLPNSVAVGRGGSLALPGSVQAEKIKVAKGGTLIIEVQEVRPPEDAFRLLPAPAPAIPGELASDVAVEVAGDATGVDTSNGKGVGAALPLLALGAAAFLLWILYR